LRTTLALLAFPHYSLPAMVRFQLFGIPIEVQPWLWVTLAIFGGAFGPLSPQALLVIALFMVAGAVSLLVHELGHALTIRRFGAPTRIVLHAFGGYALHPAGIFDRKQQFLVSAAGPGLQLLLGGAAWLVLTFIPLPTLLAKVLFANLFLISMFWAILNLVPVIPLDGGQMMSSVLGHHRRSLALRISIATAACIGGLMFWKLGSFIFPIFLGIFAYQNFQELKNFRGA
jgi:stage IV sporulation protein FB